MELDYLRHLVKLGQNVRVPGLERLAILHHLFRRVGC